MSRPPVVAVVGATATGKTDLGEALAARLGGEVVCADSRQVFRELDVGTGKPSAAERGVRPHHLFDALSIGEPASAGWYARAAGAAIAEIRARGRVPVLVGGSGLYLRAAEDGLAATPAANAAIRERFEQAWDAGGAVTAFERLRREDPETAARLDPADRQRIVRALEVLESSGRPMSWWHRQPRTGAVPGPWRVIEIGLAAPVLAERIERRARWMFGAGLIEETERVRQSGGAEALRKLRAVGYDEALALLEGTLSRPEAEAFTILRTRQLAKRQRTWFRHQSAGVRLDGGLAGEELLERAVAIASAGP